MNIKISKIVQEKPKNLMNDLIKYINQKKTEVHKEQLKLIKYIFKKNEIETFNLRYKVPKTDKKIKFKNDEYNNKFSLININH